MRMFFRIFWILAGIFAILWGTHFLLLYTSGEKAYAHITYADKKIGRRGNGYNVHYEFKLQDGSLQTGSASFSSNGGREPRGFINVRYFAAFPSLNFPSGSGMIAYFIVFSLMGVVIIVFSIRSIIKLNKLKERARRIVKRELDEREEVHSPEIKTIENKYKVLIVILLLVPFLGWYLYQSGFLKAQKDTQIYESFKGMSKGNTQANSVADGMFLGHGEYVYFSNWNDNQKLYRIKQNGTDLTKILDTTVNCLNFSDNFLFYTNFYDGSKIYKVDLDGKSPRKIYDYKSSDINLVGEWLFFINENDHNRIYKLRTDGRKETKLNNDESKSINIDDEWIYYINETDNSSMYRMRSDGSQRKKISTDSASDLVLDADFAYYNNASDQGKLYRMKKDGSNKAKFTDLKAGFINFSLQYVFINCPEKSGSVIRFDKDGKNQKELNKLDSWFLSIVGNSIYYIDCWDTAKVYKMNFDGEDNKPLQ